MGGEDCQFDLLVGWGGLVMLFLTFVISYYQVPPC